VKSRRVLEYRSPILKFPTTGAIAGNKLYFTANAVNSGFHQASTPYERGGTA